MIAMSTFSILHGTQRMVNGHLIGVIGSELSKNGQGLARLGVRAGDDGSVERFTISEGQSVTLSDGWIIRLANMEVLETGGGKATLNLELLPADNPAGL